MALDQRLKVTIHLKSPLLITAQQVGFVWESEEYIPGGVLRGAVAEVAARHDQNLKTLFDRPNAPRFGHAYAGLGSPVGILPQTARTCKRYGGFRRDEQDDERHGVRDTLLLQVFGEAQTEARCPICDQATVSCGGEPYTTIESSNEWRYISPRPVFRRIGRTAVARERGAVADRMLYTLEVIAEVMERDEIDDYGQPLRAAAAFHGFVLVDSADDLSWVRWLREVNHLGGARSRGLGQVRIEAEVAKASPVTEGEVIQAARQLTEGQPKATPDRLPGEMNILDRILAFNQKVYVMENLKEEDRKFWYLTINLQSDTILGDARGPRYWPESANLGLPELVEKAWWLAGYSQVRGWSAAWGLPKPVAPALAAGSTFVYRVPRGDEGLTREVLERCVTLEQDGIGRRRDEGWGWVQICTPFHIETEVRK